ncbi:alpha/beta fold hydrolase, partial [Streptomyces sp. NPDC046215]
MTSAPRRPRPFRRSRIAAKVSLPLAAAVLAPGLTGCAGSDRVAGEPALAPYYAQDITWKPCAEEKDKEVRAETERAGATAECGRLAVPVSYADLKKGDLRLALMRYRTKGQDGRKGSLVVNFGGPGTSGLARLTAYGPDGLGNAATRYDLVTFDPRGVGASSPVRCGSGLAELRHGPGASPAGRDGTAAYAEAQGKAFTTCRTTPGPVLPHVGTVNTARDLDVLRAALDEDKLHYLGFSYGSRLGAVYAHHFPRNVGRMVMDGVDAPVRDPKGAALARTAAYHKALRHAVETCTAKGDEDCMLGSDPDAAMADVERAFDGLDDEPLAWPGGGTLDRARAVAQTMALLRSREGLPETQNLLAAIVYGVRPGESATMAREAADQAAGRSPDGTYDNSGEAMTAIDCADTATRYTADQVADAYEEFVEASPVFGPSMVTGMAACTGWPLRGDDASRDVRAVGAPKILMHTGEYDPATPVRWLTAMAR